MPVKLEHLHTPTTVDWQDLEKIHQDTASNGFRLTQEQLHSWLEDGGWIIAGRFNDRLIGALLARETPAGVELSQAGVRSVTQRRGVMHQMLHFIQRWAQEEGKRLLVRDCPENLRPALQHRGFMAADGELQYRHNG